MWKELDNAWGYQVARLLIQQGWNSERLLSELSDADETRNFLTRLARSGRIAPEEVEVLGRQAADRIREYEEERIRCLVAREWGAEIELHLDPGAPLAETLRRDGMDDQSVTYLVDGYDLSCPFCDLRLCKEQTDGGRICPICSADMVFRDEETSKRREKRLVDDRYDLQGRIGEGGMGAVYRARDLELDRHVAIKFNKGRPERFLREARTMAKLDHPGIIQVHDMGEDPERGAYIVMELLDGVPLDQLLEDTVLEPEKALELLSQVAEAVHHAHEATVIHRDLKPANIMCREDGSVTVLDFGLAKAEDDVRLTKTGIRIGTPFYMAPEQLQPSEGQQPDRRTDVYALGTILYQCLTGELPFGNADSKSALIYQILTQRPNSPRSRNPNVSSKVASICLTALEKDPDDRFQSAAEFRTALADVGTSKQVWNRKVVTGAVLGSLSLLLLLPFLLPNETKTDREKRQAAIPASAEPDDEPPETPDSAEEGWTRIHTSQAGEAYLVPTLDPRDEKKLYAASTIGPWRSLDGGKSWAPARTGMPENAGCTHLLHDPTDSESLYALVSSDEGRGLGVYKTDDGGETWSAANKGLPTGKRGLPGISLALAPSSPEILYLGGSFGKFFKSIDSGTSWTTCASARCDVQGLAVDVASADSVYLGTNPEGMKLTTNGGDSLKVKNLGLVTDACPVVTASPSQSGTAYAAGRNAAYQTSTAGDGWVRLGMNLPLGQVVDLKESPAASSRLYLATASSVYTSNDTGRTWHDITKGLQGIVPTGLAPSATNPDLVYLTTRSGIHRGYFPLPAPEEKAPQIVVRYIGCNRRRWVMIAQNIGDSSTPANFRFSWHFENPVAEEGNLSNKKFVPGEAVRLEGGEEHIVAFDTKPIPRGQGVLLEVDAHTNAPLRPQGDGTEPGREGTRTDRVRLRLRAGEPHARKCFPLPDPHEPPVPTGLRIAGPRRSDTGRRLYVSPGRVTFSWDPVLNGEGGYEFQFRRAGQKFRSVDVEKRTDHTMYLPPPDHPTSCVWRVRAYKITPDDEKRYSKYSTEMNFELRTE